MTGFRRRAGAAVAVLLAAGSGGCAASGDDGAPPERTAAAIRPAFEVPEPRLLASTPTARWAPVETAVVARASPGGSRVARLSSRTPEGTTNLVEIVGRTRRSAGRLWVRVRLPILPNGSTGWVPRAALGGNHAVDTRLIVDRRALRAVLLKDGRRVFSAPVGVGTERWPTPPGRSHVRVKLTKYSSPFYGPIAFGTSARSPVLTDWPAGGFVGIHGTNRPDLIPGRISHGCVRLRNADILKLDELMPVGTPVSIT